MKDNKIVPIRAGECILKEKPFVYVLKSKYRTERCDLCFSVQKVLKCSSCQYVYYCGRHCQKQAWPQHKIECGFLQKIYPRIVPDAARILSRIILKLQNNGDLERGYYTEKGYRKFKDLMSHYHDIKADPRRMEHFESLSHVLKDILGNVLVPNPVELLGIYGRLIVNGFNILDGEMNVVGTGIYLGVSILDHSCKPNAVATFEGTTIYIKALEDIPCLDFSKIFISYIDVMNTPEDRRNDLKDNYYFLCTCSKCINPNETIEMLLAACPNNNCNEAIDLTGNNIEKCGKCNAKITNEFIEEYKNVTEFTKHHLSNMKNVAYLDVCEICLKKHENILHPLNLWHVKTLDMAFESSIEMGKWTEALNYGLKLVPGFKKYNGNLNPLLGMLYMKIGKIQIYLDKNTEASYYLKEAEKILKITHGSQHSIYRNQLIPLLTQISN